MMVKLYRHLYNWLLLNNLPVSVIVLQLAKSFLFYFVKFHFYIVTLRIGVYPVWIGWTVFCCCCTFSWTISFFHCWFCLILYVVFLFYILFPFQCNYSCRFSVWGGVGAIMTIYTLFIVSSTYTQQHKK